MHGPELRDMQSARALRTLWMLTAAVDHGPHPTAQTQEFEEDIKYQVKADFCKVYLLDKLQKLRQANWKISLVAIVLQVGHCGRIILDLSFPVYQDLDGVVTITQKD